MKGETKYEEREEVLEGHNLVRKKKKKKKTRRRRRRR